jgi:hypothetical protein
MIFEFKIKMWHFWKKYVLNFFKHGRQAYHLGWVRVNNIEDIEAKLINIGFQPNHFSFGDEGQLTSMRRMYVDAGGYWRQHHIRVHKSDPTRGGLCEIRGHDEFSYEEDAVGHVNGEGLLELSSDIHMKILLAVGGIYDENSI